MAGQSNTFDGTRVSGGFNVQGNQFNGNVSIGGPCHDHTDDLKCLRLLKTVNPEDERRRILTVKDQLVTASYSWILEDETFQSWRDEDTNHLLWIKGGPGKGKTMMMAGLVDVLSETRDSEGAVALSYFFCQNSESELRNVVSIVKGLIYMLALGERSLVHHLKKKYEAGGEDVFTGPRVLFTLWHVLEDMLRDFDGARVYLLIDGLDECDDREFDDFLHLLSSCKTTTPGKVKWLVASRPLGRIEDIIGPDQDRYRISLEIEAQNVSRGVETFITEKVKNLQNKRHWSEEITQKVHSYLQNNAQGTFLWVALVCQRLQRFAPWKVENELTNLANLQQGLVPFYDRMMQVVRDENPDDTELCLRILRTTTLVYRPLRLQELGTVIDGLQSDDPPSLDALRDLIERCGSFILVHEDTIYFVHQSAKDYLSGEPGSKNFPLSRLQHASIAERCLDTLKLRLKDRQFPDPTSFNKKELGEDELRLLSTIAYACSYWIHHTLESIAQNSYEGSIPNQKKICDLFDSQLIAWVHTLGSLKELTACVRMIKAFLDIQGFESTDFFHMVQDTYRFLRLNKQIVEESPNQVYTSALLFVPKSSRIRQNYQSLIPKWIRLRTRLNDTWDACLETLLGHLETVRSVTFSSDGSLLASRSEYCTRLWETENGKCRFMLSHDMYTPELTFSPDDRVLLTGSENRLELVDTATGSQQHSFVSGPPWMRRCLFAPNSQILASADYRSVTLWNVSTGSSCGIFIFRRSEEGGIAFSHDSKCIAMSFSDGIKVWNLETSSTVATFQKHFGTVFSIQFSPDSCLVLSASYESVRLWTYATMKTAKELQGSLRQVRCAKFSPDGSLIVFMDETETSVTVWETSTGNKLHVFPVPFSDLCKHSEPMFSPDSRVIVTPLSKGAKTWDTTTGEHITTFEASEETVRAHADISICSKDGKLFAQAMGSEVRIWEVATGVLLRTLEGHSGSVFGLAFSPVGGLIASASRDRTVKLWSLTKGPSSQATIRNGISPMGAVTISLDGTLAASWLSFKEGIRLWDLESGFSRTLHNKPDVYPFELVISLDNSLLAVSDHFNVSIYETENGSLRYRSTGSGQDFIERMAFSPDSLLLLIEFQDGRIQIVENLAQEFEDVQEPSHEEPTQSQDSPDGRFSVSVERIFGTVFLWELQKDTEERKFKFILGLSGGVATFSPDSKLVALVSNERSLSVWETETGVSHGVPGDTVSYTSVVSFSPDNRFIAYTFGDERSLGLLELRNGLSRRLGLACADFFSLLTFSPDASMFAAVSGSAIFLCETMSGSVTGKLEYDQKQVSDITFLPDQNILMAEHEDGTIRHWDMNDYVLVPTLRTEDRAPRFFWDSERKFLWTGTQKILPGEVLQPCKEPTISLKDNWILFNEQRVFWLPTEFRPGGVWAASEKCLVMGHQSGDLTIVHFDI